ncbi:cytochrome P450 93G1-like [Cocos nucifera]|uniref:Cytochrome P450 93G1-like n=1 Tax=Cocos nucifera TaxID=13894 RepID=A0A8K0HVF3_COCNU|nr:cytochrome P450 93G1-like [Cocos nucifera]
MQDIFTAGSNSSSATIECGLAELINHPEAMEKVREEIDRVVGKDRAVEETDLANLPYLQAVLKETMRLHPAAPVCSTGRRGSWRTWWRSMSGGQHFQLLPFGSGRRGCPGMVQAMQVVSVTVAAVVQGFEGEVVGGEGRVDMEEKEGMVASRQRPLVLVPVARFDAFPALA